MEETEREKRREDRSRSEAAVPEVLAIAEWEPWAELSTPSDFGSERPAKPSIASALASRATISSKNSV